WFALGYLAVNMDVDVRLPEREPCVLGCCGHGVQQASRPFEQAAGDRGLAALRVVIDGELNRHACRAAKVVAIEVFAIRAFVRGSAPGRIVEAQSCDGKAFPGDG